MLFFLLALLLCGLAGLGAYLWHRHARKKPDFAPKALLTNNEKEFMGRLLKALPDYFIMVQVSMGALMQPSRYQQGRDYMSTRAKFCQKVVDYVVVDDKFEVVCLIELDDITHDKDKDARRDTMTREAGYVTLRYESREKPDIEQIKKDVQMARKKSKVGKKLPTSPRRWLRQAVLALGVLITVFGLYFLMNRTRVQLQKADVLAIHYLAPQGYRLAYRNKDCLQLLNRLQQADSANAPDEKRDAFNLGVVNGCFVQESSP